MPSRYSAAGLASVPFLLVLACAADPASRPRAAGDDRSTGASPEAGGRLDGGSAAGGAQVGFGGSAGASNLADGPGAGGARAEDGGGAAGSPGLGGDAGRAEGVPSGGAAGALEVSAGEKIVNDCFTLAKAEEADVTLDAATVAKIPDGMTLLLWQVQDKFAGSGDGADITTGAKLGRAGNWEVARVTSSRAVGTALVATLAERPRATYGTDSAMGRTAQACTVPDFSDVTVSAGAKITASPWNGKTGGVVALLVKNALTVDGEISATGRGFRGGPWDMKAFHADNYANRKLTDLDTKEAIGGRKGEGADGSAFGLTKEGRGNYANGAGGGNNTHAAGGGGASAGKGGFGGMQHGFYGAGEPNTRGMGGAAVKLSLRERLVMGGGGGQGQQVTNNCRPNSCRAAGFATDVAQLTNGGVGGGLVWLQVGALKGKGIIAADGTRGGCAECDGSGGGGGGGAIALKVAALDFSGAVNARGGGGGDNLNVNSRVGPGGGGGGGRVRVEAPAGASLKTDTKGGTNGMHYCGQINGRCPGNGPTAKDAYGATPGGDGVVEGG